LRSDDMAALVEWYDKLSGGYDELYAKEQSAKYDAALEIVGAREFDVVLDVACGTGLFLDRLGMMSGLVVGVDASREMLEGAKRRGASGKVSLVRADCAWLPLRDQVADCVFAISLLKADGEQLGEQVSEMSRVVRQKGFVVATVFRKDDRVPLNVPGLVSTLKLRDVSSREALFVFHRAML
jgi:ubiquinone/menaquinone biosynthesis C-methylase UbiE